jgi:hypothetical protein
VIRSYLRRHHYQVRGGLLAARNILDLGYREEKGHPTLKGTESGQWITNAIAPRPTPLSQSNIPHNTI